jgi:hypothetical protein
VRPSFLKRVYWSYFARPAAERPLFRSLIKRSVRQIVEIGVGDCSRAKRLIQLATRIHGPVTYCGIDLFEASPADRPGIKYKDAFCKLKFTSCHTKLVPGRPDTALASCANSLTNSELIIVSQRFTTDELAPAWMYIPRMLAAQAELFREQADGSFAPLSLAQLLALSDRAAEIRRKSA